MNRMMRGEAVKNLGADGEQIAAEFLEELGYRIVARNFRAGHDELDIICRDGCDLRFVEVKTRREPMQGEAWEAVGMTKQRNIGRAAKAFLASEQCHNLGFRVDESHFDVVTIVWDEMGESYKTEYYPDAFLLIYI